MNRRQFVLGCACLPPALGSDVRALAQHVLAPWSSKPIAGDRVNLARYGRFQSWLDPETPSLEEFASEVLPLARLSKGNSSGDFGVEWPEFRTVQEVTIDFDSDSVASGSLFLEYWDGLTVLQGGWKAFDQGPLNWNHLAVHGRRWTFQFTPRRTCKVRLRWSEPVQAAITQFAVLGPSVWKAADLRIEWGHDSRGPWNGHLETYNAEILSVGSLGAANWDCAQESWKSPSGKESGVRLSLLYAVGMDVDRSIITVRSEYGDCSFLPGEAIESEPIDIIDHGIYVRSMEDATDATAYRARQSGRLRVIDAVPKEPEQTLENAYAHIRARRVTLSFVGAEANNQKFGIAPDGHFVIGNNDPLAGDPIVPGFAVYFDTSQQPFLFQPNPFPDAVFRSEKESTDWVAPKQQMLKEGWLPIVQTLWSENALGFERTDFGALLHPRVPESLVGNEPAVLYSRLTIRNGSTQREIANYYIRPWKPSGLPDFPYGGIPAEAREGWTTGVQDRLVTVSDGKKELLLCAVETYGKGSLSLAPAHNAVLYSLILEPGEDHSIDIFLPGWQPALHESPDLLSLSYDKALDETIQYWKNRAAPAMQIRIPDRHLQNLFDATLQHFLLVTTKNGAIKQHFPNVAMFYYGSIGSESSPIIRALDMRGMHEIAEQCLEAFLVSQGENMPEGDYRAKEGGFYRFWPNYTVDQGGVLWALADHYRYTQDDQWLHRVAPKILRGCQFIVQARKQTMHVNPDGAKPLHYGLAPAGCVADPRDWQYSFMLNAWFYAGLKRCAEIMQNVDANNAKALLSEAEDYKQCILRALKESIALSPVTRLRDNSSVASVPPYLGLRGFSSDVKDSVDPDRRHGYGYDCTIGPFHLFNCGILDAEDPVVTAMLNYFEDRFFLFSPLPSRVDLDQLSTDWFNLGGFEKLQPYYVQYQKAYLIRDQIPNFLRGFYNTVASIADPVTLTFQEELDLRGGQPHKTHEEGWFFHQIRDMLVVEIGPELHLCRAAPRAWFEPGKEISVQAAPTYFGKITYRIQTAADGQSISAEITPSPEFLAAPVILSLRHPGEKPIRKVVIDGHPWEKFDTDKESIQLPTGFKKISLVASY